MNYFKVTYYYLPSNLSATTIIEKTYHFKSDKIINIYDLSICFTNNGVHRGDSLQGLPIINNINEEDYNKIVKHKQYEI